MIKGGGLKHVPCVEDEDFIQALDKMMLENLQVLTVALIQNIRYKILRFTKKKFFKQELILTLCGHIATLKGSRSVFLGNNWDFFFEEF